ncbi:outer membrane beta-barrel protein [Polaribacter batillariae]|uniref:Outer membrane beta-barrel protein n=1 Tax=Polaribacter batillariae TaxID=2808900 RepID=A0ABX7STH7_9FLAO|nr:outer membrane beta-barrel protein [Polaribacter batillariae]QTD37552.1 outer membrane beta-barrel protein [Polaribacter batillariae]
MKKILMLSLVLFLGLNKLNAQKSTSYGITAGYHNLTSKVSASNLENNLTVSNGLDGYYVGFFLESKISEKLSFQPEVQFSQIFNEGESLNSIIIPMYLKYYVDTKLSLQGGALLDIVLDKDQDEEGKVFGVGLGLGLGYDVSDKILLSTKYSFGLNNRISTDRVENLTVRFNFFQIGLGYRF